MSLVEALARDVERAAAAEPALAGLRRDAFARVRAHGLPSVREEDWRYTDLSDLAALPRTLPAAHRNRPTGPLPLEGVAGPRLVFVDGSYRADLSSPPAGETGLGWWPLGALLREDPERAAELLAPRGKAGQPVLAALNTALAPDGVHIEVSGGAAPTVLLVFLATRATAAALLVPRITVRLAADAGLTLVEAYAGEAGAENFTNALTDVELGARARLTHVRVQDEAPGAAHIGQLHLSVGEDADARSFAFAFGSRLARLDVVASLVARGAATTLNGLFLAGAGQHLDHYTRIDHEAGATHSAELYKGLADGDGRGVFRGAIVVRPGAQKIAATQASHNLLLSPVAEIDTRPELEIYADDVTCAHGATVGQLDDQALFYLRARGIPEAEARELLVQGFAQQIIDELPLPALREWLEARLRSGVAAALGNAA